MVFERFVFEELASWIREDCRSAEIPIGVAGTSLGAFYSANVALKYPTVFRYALCMSGRYEMTGFTNGLANMDVYFNNPMAYVANLHGEQLERIRQHTHLTLVCGRGKWEDGNIEETQRLAELLGSKGISHECDIWGQDVAHEWVWWRRQARHHLGKRIAG
jgi:esterase/lipase superfamily enzyme